MSKIDFVPNEYIQQRESSRANWMYLGLLLAVLVGMGVTFSLLKIRQKKVDSEIAALDERLLKAQEKITLLDELEAKGKVMMEKAMITADLPDQVNKSVVLAALTNCIPDGVYLKDVNIRDKEIKLQNVSAKPKTQFEAAKANAANKRSVEIVKETHIELSGKAGTDIEVAAYIESLGKSFLVRSVGLVESSEQKVDEVKFREFKLKVKLKRDVRVTSEELDGIRRDGGKVAVNSD